MLPPAPNLGLIEVPALDPMDCLFRFGSILLKNVYMINLISNYFSNKRNCFLKDKKKDRISFERVAKLDKCLSIKEAIQYNIKLLMTEEIEPHILKKYEIVEKLGKGAYGIVWKAVDRKLKQVVALKKVFYRS